MSQRVREASEGLGFWHLRQPGLIRWRHSPIIMAWPPVHFGKWCAMAAARSLASINRQEASMKRIILATALAIAALVAVSSAGPAQAQPYWYPGNGPTQGGG
jgi:hypothetical protein